jgi:hypothetical protein
MCSIQEPFLRFLGREVAPEAENDRFSEDMEAGTERR